MSSGQAALFGGAITAGALVLIAQLIALWPAVLTASTTGKAVSVTWLLGLVHTVLQPEAAILAMVALVGALASLAEESFRFVKDSSDYRRPARRLTWFYVLRPLQGAVLAVVVYFTLRGGLLGTNAAPADMNAYGIAAFSGLVGLFTRQAYDRLRKVFDTLWGSMGL